MEVVETRDRDAIADFLQRDAPTNLYALADLDDFFWPDTKWFAAQQSGEIRALCLMLSSLDPTIVVALDPSGRSPLRELLCELRGELPDRFFLNLSPGLEEVFQGRGELRSHGTHQKMIWAERAAPSGVSAASVVRLSVEHADEIERFLSQDAYGEGERDGRFFAPYMLEQGPCFGVREGGRLICFGGVHVNCERYGVAALGNLAARPDRRRRGHGRRIAAAICRELIDRLHVGLNVGEHNRAAIACYEGLGFRRVCSYLEATVTGWHAG